MRTLTGKMGINEETFEPVLILMLDGVASGTTLQIEAISDINALHGSEAVQAIIEMTVDHIDRLHKLSKEESDHYRTNFKSLIAIK